MHRTGPYNKKIVIGPNLLSEMSICQNPRHYDFCIYLNTGIQKDLLPSATGPIPDASLCAFLEQMDSNNRYSLGQSKITVG